MSISNLSVLDYKTGNHFFNRTAEDITEYKIFGYLRGEKRAISESTLQNDQSILRTVAVCKDWKNNPVLQKEQKEAAIRIRQRAHFQETLLFIEYPRSLTQAFNESCQSISKLPTLDVGDLTAEQLMSMELEQMTQPLVRLRDQTGRIGIAFKIAVSARLVREEYREFLSFQIVDAIRNHDLKLLSFVPVNIWEAVRDVFTPYESILIIYRSVNGSLQFGRGKGHFFTPEWLYHRRAQKNGLGEDYEWIVSGGGDGGIGCNTKFFIRLLKGEDPDFYLPELKAQGKRTAGFSVGKIAIATVTTIALTWLAQWAYWSAE